MIRKTSFLFLLAFLALLSSAQAQTPLTLKQAVSLALAKNLQIQVAQQDLAIADAQENWGNAGFLPSLSTGATYGTSVNDVTQELANGNQGAQEFRDAQNTQLTYDVTASYVLFNGLGRLNNLQRLQLQKELTQTQLRFTIENTLLQVFTSYFNTAQQQSLVQVSQESLKISARRYQRAQAAAELGSQNSLARLSALVDLRNDSISYLNAYNQWQKSRRQLSQALNLPIDTTYAVDTAVALAGDFNFLSLQNQALNNNAALVQAEMSRALAKKDVNIAWSQRLPEISANGGYNYSRQENEGGFLRLTEVSGWQYGLNARWNLFNGYRTQTQIESARLRVYQSNLQLEQARQQLRVDLANAWLDFENNKKVLAVQKRNLKVTLQNLKRAQEAYKLGQVTNTELRQAQLNYVNAKTNLNGLAYNVKLAELELMRVAGGLIAEVKE